MYKPSSFVTSLIYEKFMNEQLKRINELRDPSIIYVTDLVSCTHKYHLKKLYPELSLMFEPAAILGNIAHLGLGSLLKEKNIEVEIEVSLDVEVDDKKYIIKGRVDAIDKNNNLIVEIKTARSAIDLPKDHHIKQLNIYLNMLNIPQGVLIYITPDRILEYSIQRDRIDLSKEIRDLIDDLYHPKYEWECSYCTYRKMCHYYKTRDREKELMVSK